MTERSLTRREAIGACLSAGAAIALGACASRAARTGSREPLYTISLAQWSYHRAVHSGTMTTMDFPGIALREHGIDAVEYVSTLFPRKDLAAEAKELRARCDDLRVRSLLIMVDAEGALGDPDRDARARAVENHRKWLEAASALGCHSIRVNAESRGTPDEQERLAADGLRALCERAEPFGLDVVVENHWGLSSTAPWLMAVMRRVDHPRVGTLPDFGNFDPKVQDRYDAVRAMMPLARAVSAKSNDFDPQGNESTTDYLHMLRIVADSGYRGRVGIEYEGSRLAERDGIDATKRLLERVRDTLQRENTYA
ncbi:MAG: sugar phosphate isomerase/epimerase [Phycisphaeraceae bacterium]|nr:sugar phosphate isomerase/epimerase [Phycisphaeraceae bacterium]